MGFEDVRNVIRRKRTYEILEYIDNSDNRNFSEITAEIDSSSDTISQTLDVLCEYDLITRRERSQKDVRYMITKKGEHAREEIIKFEEILCPKTPDK